MELRKERRLTQQEISKSLKMARTTYSGYENGSREPDNETLNKIADFLEVSVDYLLGRTEQRKQVLSEPSRALIDSLNLTDEEIMKNIRFEVDGIELEEDDVKRFIGLVRLERSMRKKQSE
ncbi:transcriptional regulator with XRE-family HTH domain [Paenibacillus xylanexedens]|uniref:Transcriptional regulator with XRE-family HTH domain n=1 Tax=Paenibacillus xylanexedens TaxID=528191 RepID=A0ABS4RLR9_PAEXY|nr:transcriptional regulator with XRE-family HTH domain [Paenibacillus xylanexedens]